MAIAAGQPIKASDVNNALDSKADKTTVDSISAALGGKADTTTVNNISAAIDTLGFFPIGAILIFSGSAYSSASATFKQKWKICNGADGTPNLVGKFLRGAESSGSTAGADSVSLTASHIPSHTHSFSGTSSGGSSHSHGLSGNTGTGGSHTHDTHTGSFSIGDDDTNDSYARVVGDGVFSGAKITGKEFASFYGSSVQTDTDKKNSLDMNATHSIHTGHTHSLSSGTIGKESAHTHTYSGDTGGYGASSVTAVPTVPSYYTVIYIIKVA